MQLARMKERMFGFFMKGNEPMRSAAEKSEGQGMQRYPQELVAIRFEPKEHSKL